jgi:hypothetical protein
MMWHREALERVAALRGFTRAYSTVPAVEPEPRLVAPLNARPLTAAAAGEIPVLAYMGALDVKRKIVPQATRPFPPSAKWPSSNRTQAVPRAARLETCWDCV